MISLSLIVFLPAIGALLCLFVPKQQVRVVAVVASLLALLASLALFPTFLEGGEATFGSSYGTLHFIERALWIQGTQRLKDFFLYIFRVAKLTS